jgi:hypothetical protein
MGCSPAAIPAQLSIATFPKLAGMSSSDVSSFFRMRLASEETEESPLGEPVANVLPTSGSISVIG